MAAYLREGLKLYEGCRGHDSAVRDLQKDLRALGYLCCGIDGLYGSATAQAVRALQYDLLHNHGISNCGRPVRAAVVMTEYNQDEDGQPRVTEITGVLDQKLAAVLAALIANPKIGLVPQADDPAAANAAACRAVSAMTDAPAPPDFVLAVARQESAGEHFRHLDDDHSLNVGFYHEDRTNPDFITARGYGLGQYTLFVQPPDTALMAKMTDPVCNVRQIAEALSDKLAHFLIGGTADTTAEDRVAAFGHKPLRRCKYGEDDPRHMKDCRACVRALATRDIDPGTPLYPQARARFQISPYYSMAHYRGVPVPEAFACDWPYAVRRYNGTGLNSYHYQVHVLQHLLEGADMEETI